ncbi:MAG: hypothetical protein GC171_08875 [Terrimonas sp.]|nr:hypothetical protein [Terrimonas sp.]
MQYITINDYLLLPIFLFIVYILAAYYRNKYYPIKHPLRKYFFPAFTVKIVGAIFIGIIYQYYYKGGDTLNYWDHTVTINSSLHDSFNTWFKLITASADPYDTDVFPYTAKMYWYTSPPEYIIASIGAFIGLFTLTTYLPTSIIYAAISFIGIWKMFVVFTKLYPRLEKQMAISFLFIPSVFFWGSGFLKDTLTLSCIGWLVHYFYLIFYENKKIVSNTFKAFFFLYIVFIVKSYIVMAFLPAALLWGMGLLSYKIKDTKWIIVSRYMLYGISLVGLLVVGGRMQTQVFGEYNVESLAYKSTVTRDYLLRVSQEQDGSSYSLGDIDPTLAGMIQKAPAAINVTLFRPYFWESRKPIVLISAVESLAFLLFTIAAILKNNPLRVVLRILGDETLQFCLIFTLVFAFAVGISTNNFGSLSRYKIPCMPFYLAFLFILFNPPKVELISRKQFQKKKGSTAQTVG